MAGALGEAQSILSSRLAQRGSGSGSGFASHFGMPSSLRLCLVVAVLVSTGCTGSIEGPTFTLLPENEPNSPDAEPSSMAPSGGERPAEPEVDRPTDTGGPPDYIPPEGDPNDLDNTTLFTCTPNKAGSVTPKRIWRLSGSQFVRAVLSITNGRRADLTLGTASQVLDGSPGQVFTNVASQAAMDPPTFETLLRGITAEGEDWVNEGYKRSRDAPVHCMSNELPVTDACFTRFLKHILTLGFRRPPTDSEVQRYRERIGPTLASDGATTAAQMTLAAIVLSPEFLFRSEVGVPLAGSTSNQLTPFEVASALSFTFTDSPPDSTLYNAAMKDELRTAEQIRAQVLRLLDSDSRQTYLSRFFAQLYGYESAALVFKSADDVKRAYQNGNTSLLGAFSSTRTKLASIARSSGLLTKLLTEPFGSEPDRVGVLTDQSVLWAYSTSEGSDPIRRGRLITERILCNTLPSRTIPDIPEISHAPTATLREKLVQHRSSAACSTCHVYLDQIGLGLERFDGFGHRRETEQGRPLDTTGILTGSGSATDGPFDGPVELASKLKNSARTRQCFIRQIFRYTSGRNESTDDACLLAAVDNEFKTKEKIDEILVSYFTSQIFLQRK